ncbi:DUF4157 domain-containing protein [Tumidithrix elongata RA019]|uniref:DUF4157 domain-containing protein n=1 Tax=Tumidithrix elongata BACA0141 TaxID=2716417 RepID=A0AAW9PTY8_9CYAN|nr:DUF4157 domain-containing protein [Tumidithrix elongata RA019]
MRRYRISAKKQARQDRESQPSFTNNTLQMRPFAPPQESQVQPPSEDRTAELGHRLENISFQPRPQVDIMARKWEGIRAAYQAKQVQAKLAIGAVGDKYEQEADQVASQVVQTINTPENVQREDEEQVQTKPLESIQREEAPEEEDETLQMKPLSNSIQREEAPEEEDEELQMKPMLQRREAVDGGDASEELEGSIQQAKSSGQPLDPKLQAKMGQAMGADFSSVKVHTDSQSDQLNQSIQAKAFTTGRDVFFRQGAYDPNSRNGQELIAHELTHVVQQRSHQSPKSVQQDQVAIAKAQTVTSIQRKVFIGVNYEELENSEHEKENTLCNDEVVRRFKDRDEFQTYAQNPKSVEGIGLLGGKTWIRLPEKMLVMGEDHSNTEGPNIIKSTNIKKFRYEGIVEHDESNNKNELEKDSKEEILFKRGIGDKEGNTNYAAENAYARYARGLADILEIVKAQEKHKESTDDLILKGYHIKPENYLREGQLVTRLVPYLLYALKYCLSSTETSLKKFSKDYNDKLLTSIEILEKREKDRLPNLSKLKIAPHLDELTKLFEEKAQEKTGLDTWWKRYQWKKKLNTKKEAKVTIGKRAKEDDYLRDKSMYDTMIEASKNEYRLFVIGEGHRKKLVPLLEKESIESKEQDEYLKEEKEKNENALKMKN